MRQKPEPRKKARRVPAKAGARSARGGAGKGRGGVSALKGAAPAKGLDESTRDWLHRTLLNEVREMVLVFGADGRVMSVNAAGLEILGYSEEELRALPNLSALVVLEDRAFAEERFATLFSTGQPQTKTLRLMRKDGAVRWVEWRCRALREQGGVVKFVVGVGRDLR
ncbi:MAG: PAS domain-containing protein, partial [Phycisphaerae bacterium]|nr:PAS domain-containing protein [Phycisphaerae bacterium]